MIPHYSKIDPSLHFILSPLDNRGRLIFRSVILFAAPLHLTALLGAVSTDPNDVQGESCLLQRNFNVYQPDFQ